MVVGFAHRDFSYLQYVQHPIGGIIERVSEDGCRVVTPELFEELQIAYSTRNGGASSGNGGALRRGAVFTLSYLKTIPVPLNAY